MPWRQSAIAVTVTLFLCHWLLEPLYCPRSLVPVLLVVDGFARVAWTGYRQGSRRSLLILLAAIVVLASLMSIESSTPYAQTAEWLSAQLEISMLMSAYVYFTNASSISMNSLACFASAIHLYLLNCWLSLKRRIANVLGVKSPTSFQNAKSMSYAVLSQPSVTRRPRRVSTSASPTSSPANTRLKPVGYYWISESTEKNGDALPTSSPENAPHNPPTSVSASYETLWPTSLVSSSPYDTALSVQELLTVTRATPVDTISSPVTTSLRRDSSFTIEETEKIQPTSNSSDGYPSAIEITDTPYGSAIGTQFADSSDGVTGSRNDRAFFVAK